MAGEKTKRETWRDWLPANAPEPEQLLTRAEVVARLQEGGWKVSADNLRFWEQQGALPHPLRQGHRGATRAVYPDWFVPLVGRMRELQQQRVRIDEIAGILRVYVRLVLADGDKIEDTPLPFTPPSEHDYEEALRIALHDYVLDYERRYQIPRIGGAVVVFLTPEGRDLRAADGSRMEFVMHLVPEG